MSSRAVTRGEPVRPAREVVVVWALLALMLDAVFARTRACRRRCSTT
ncbi:MAG TPA: hypothetical protein VFA30_04030 [Gaiellaceae bacterium]|nr:hypothetical protein [Gaiellaceae bacterium]